MPDKLAELQELFLEEARKYGVRRSTIAGSSASTRPCRQTDLDQRDHAAPLRRMGHLTENVLLNVKNKSHSVTAEVVVPEGGATGVVLAQGGAYGGWSAVRARRQARRTATTSSGSSGSRPTARWYPCGTHQVRTEFAYDGGGLAEGWCRPLSSTERPSERDVWRAPSRWSSRLTRRRTSDATRPRPCRMTTRLREHLQRHGAMGTDRPRRGLRGSRPSDHAGGTVPLRDGSAVASRRDRTRGGRWRLIPATSSVSRKDEQRSDQRLRGSSRFGRRARSRRI